MPIYKLIKYSDNYLKISGNLHQYYRDDLNDHIKESESFKFKIKKTPAARNTEDVKVVAQLKYLLIFGELLKRH